MKIFNKILCPVDFSDPAKHALQFAQRFTEVFNSQLELLHVSPNITEAYAALMPDFPSYELKQENLMDQFNEFTSDWSGKMKKVIRAGTPYLEILDHAHKNAFDLIVLGAQGHSKFERLFLGVTGEKVARKSVCPVLTVHRAPENIERILVPIDFSPLSYEVLPTVATIADAFEAEIYLLHVVETGQYPNQEHQKREYAYFEQVKERLAEQWELPEAFNKIETNKFIRHHAGSAGYAILEFARDWDIDLIAMATHGRSGLSKVLMGSVTEKVIKIAECPVMSIRSQFEN